MTTANRSKLRSLVGRAALLFTAAGIVSTAFATPAQAISTQNVVPGATLIVVHADGSDRSMCTAGPVVSLRDGGRAFTTAGHCGKDGDTVYWDNANGNGNRQRIGTLYHPVDDVLHGTINDYAIFAVDESFIDMRVAGTYTPTTLFTLKDVRASLNTSRDLPICSVGVTSGTRCGNVTTVDSDGTIEADFVSDHGDSGGPVYVPTTDGKHAVIVGILRGHDNITGDSVIVPIEAPLTAYNVKLSVNTAD